MSEARGVERVEQMPRWVREAHSAADIVRILDEDPTVMMAFCTPRANPDREIFGTLARESRGNAEYPSVFGGDMHSIEKIKMIVGESIQSSKKKDLLEYIKKASSIVEKDLTAFEKDTAYRVHKIRVVRTFPKTEMEAADIAYRNGLLFKWHQDVEPDTLSNRQHYHKAPKPVVDDVRFHIVFNLGKEDDRTSTMRVIRPYYGPSTEYAENQFGSNVVPLPHEIITGHRLG